MIDGKSVRTGVTTGISVFPHNGSDAASLLANAGAALFRAKAKSRGSIGVYRAGDGPADPRPPRAASGSLDGDQERRIVAALPAAGASGQTVASSEVIGFEALARWHASGARLRVRRAISSRSRKKAA